MNQTDISVFEQLELELAALRIELPSEGRSVTVTDFGARADSDFCNTEAFNQALTYCRREKAEKLIIPKGVYRFKECSQNAHLILDDMENFTLEGQGSELIFESLSSYLSICRSSRILVRDLILDWNWEKAPLSSVGVVSEVAEDGSYIECVFPAYGEIAEDMAFSIVGPFDPCCYTPGCPGGMEFRP